MPNLWSPVNGVAWPQADYYEDAPLWSPDGVVAPTGSTLPTVYSSGDAALSFGVAGSIITVNLAMFRARVGGMRYKRSGTVWTSGMAGGSPDPGSDAYPLNTNANPRIDRLVLRRDLTAGKAYPLILQGTPAASPAAPALTQVDGGTWDMPLHQWQLAGSSSTTISNIVDQRTWISSSGGKRLYVPMYPATAEPFTINAGYTASPGRNPGFWFDDSGYVHLVGAFVNTAGFTPPAGTDALTLPAKARPPVLMNFACGYSGGAYNLVIGSTGGCKIFAPATAMAASLTWGVDGVVFPAT